MNYHKIEKYSTENGIGIRCVLWVSGCSLHCKGCQNPQTWDFNSGKPFGPKEWQEVYDILKQPYIQGITFSGGHPLEEENRPTLFSLILDIKRLFPHKDIWLYTGYELNIYDFYGPSTKEAILRLCDIVVDGPYIEEQRDISLPFRGSRNQRLIDVQESLKQGKIVTLQND